MTLRHASAWFMGLLVAWIAITAVHTAYNVSYPALWRQPSDRRWVPGQ